MVDGGMVVDGWWSVNPAICRGLAGIEEKMKWGLFRTGRGIAGKGMIFGNHSHVVRRT